MINYSEWQSLGTDEPRDQQRDLAWSHWAEIGPDNRYMTDGWSWTVLTGGFTTREVAGGCTGSEDAAKQAVQGWADKYLPADECDGAPEPGDIDPDNPYDQWAQTPGGWDGYTDEDQA